MIVSVVLVIIGLALVVFAADWLVDGSCAIARKAGISEFVIGLTIVGFGTSCPELVVSLNGAFKGVSDIAVGNVIGSNIFNTLLILGLTALLAPVGVSEENRRRDIPITLLVTFMMLLCGMLGGGELSRLEGIVFLIVFAFYLWYCFKTGKAQEEDVEPVMGMWKAVALCAAGLAGLIFGGNLLVDNAIVLAKGAGVSDKFIAVTLLAGGTSLPELVTCIVAIRKKKDQLALGNILGSNVFNILLILGCSSIVTPLSFSAVTTVDAAVLLASIILIWMSTYTGRRNVIDRWEGALLLLLEFGYMAWLVINL